MVMMKADVKEIEIYCYEKGAKMFNQNQIYNIFNQQQIQAQLLQMQQQYHNQQIWKVSDCAKKLADIRHRNVGARAGTEETVQVPEQAGRGGLVFRHTVLCRLRECHVT